MSNELLIPFIKNDFEIGELENCNWLDLITVKMYWSGEVAPEKRWFKAALLWSDNFLYARFKASINEPLVLNPNPILSAKTIGLWDRDVFEIFVAPDILERERYFEFEVAPTGEWVDLAIHQMTDRRETNTNYNSGFEVASKIDQGITSAMKIPWRAFKKHPIENEFWYGNVMRAMSTPENRGYLAWQPTKWNFPNFHVPERFGKLRFIKERIIE